MPSEAVFPELAVFPEIEVLPPDALLPDVALFPDVAPLYSIALVTFGIPHTSMVAANVAAKILLLLIISFCPFSNVLYIIFSYHILL